MPRKASPHRPSPLRLLRAALVLAAVLVLARTGWLALRPHPAATLPTRAVVAGRGEPGQSDQRSSQWRETAEARRLVAELAAVCPSAAQEFGRQLAERQPSAGPIRPVAATTERKPWLVDPDEWYVPEDTPSAADEAERPPGASEPLAPPPTDQADRPAEGDRSPPQRGEPDRRKNTAPGEGPALLPPESQPDRKEPLPPTAAGRSDAPPAGEPVEPRPEPLPEPPRKSSEQPPPVPPPSPAPAGEPESDPVGRQPAFSPPPMGMPSPHSLEDAREKAAAAGIAPGEDPHAKLLAENCYPSAKTCAECHEKIYHEWSCSSHAYAFVSPMYHKFEQKITEVSKGTVGYFCQRCHSPVGTSLGMPRDMPLWQQPEVAREGVTCIACHRVNQRFGKSNGERHIVPGDEYAPVYGGIGGDGVAEVIAHKDKYKVKTSPDESGPGQAIHRQGRYFDQLSAAEACTSCHQVAVHPGIKLEVVWEQYRASPAYREGITCQDCHMGKVPGVPSGYERCAIAEVAGQTVRDDRKHANHTFYGPGYSIAHPGVFPFHLKADRWTVDQWLQFDWRAGWGTDQFEDRVHDGQIACEFPPVWANVDDRYDAREIIEDNLRKLALKDRYRKQVMENGSHVDGPFFDTEPCVGRDLKLHYVVTNTNGGHNLPTASLGAQPQFWANVVLIGPRGERLWETGYTDRYGDVCDIHSRDVRAGRVPFDSQLFNLQTMFLITGATGTDREFYLPVNVDIDQLPFLRPGAIPISVTNHPPFIRMESRSISPLGHKRVKYRIPGHLLRKPGRYRLTFRLRSRAEPIYFMDFCGATTEMQRAMNEGILDVHPYSVEFNVR